MTAAAERNPTIVAAGHVEGLLGGRSRPGAEHSSLSDGPEGRRCPIRKPEKADMNRPGRAQA